MWLAGFAGAARPAGPHRHHRGYDGTSSMSARTRSAPHCTTNARRIINGSEHLVFAHQPWLCAADVVRDPSTGRVLACIDLTSPARDGRSIALAAARAGARLAELLLERRSSTPGLLPTPAADVRLLGPGQPTAFGVPLTTRRADIVALLVEHPGGSTVTRSPTGCSATTARRPR